MMSRHQVPYTATELFSFPIMLRTLPWIINLEKNVIMYMFIGVYKNLYSTVCICESLPTGWTVISGQDDKSCEMLTSGIQRCYASIGIKLPQENIQSIMSVPLDYTEICWYSFPYKSMTCPKYNKRIHEIFFKKY